MAASRIPLSKIARDPDVAAFLARGAHDDGPEPAVAAPRRSPVLAGGEAVYPTSDGSAFDALAVHIGRGSHFAARVLEDA